MDDEQVIYDMGAMMGSEGGAVSREEAMKLAEEQTLREMAESGLTLDQKTIEEGRAKAETLIGSITAEELNELRDTIAASGLPVLRGMLKIMALAAGIKGSAMCKIDTAIDQISHIKQVGCTQIDFTDAVLDKKVTAYLVLGICDRDYDFGAALSRLNVRTGAAKNKEVDDAIRMKLSSLFNTGRQYYDFQIPNHLKLVRKINKLPADDPCTKYLRLIVDKDNTTLFIDPSWSKRIGIKVHYSDDASFGEP